MAIRPQQPFITAKYRSVVLFRLDFTDKLLHEDNRVVDVQTHLHAAVEFQVDKNLAVVIIVIEMNVMNVGKWHGVPPKMKDSHRLLPEEFERCVSIAFGD